MDEEEIRSPQITTKTVFKDIKIKNAAIVRRLKIAVVGCGAVGSYYGALLAKAGHDVHFLLRSDYAEVSRNGLAVQSANGDFHIRPLAWREPDAIGPCEIVLVALKTTANPALKHLLPPLLNDRTVVITMQNGLGNEEHLATVVAADQIMGGLCFVCINRLRPGLIKHMAHGLVMLGEHSPTAGKDRRQWIASAFQEAGIPCQPTDNLRRARWEKLTWNIPFNGLGVAAAAGIDAVRSGDAPKGIVQSCLSSDVLISDPNWESILRDLMGETIEGARALGFDLPLSLIEKQIERTRSMGPYKASTLLDFENRLPLELNSMFLEPLARARGAGAQMSCLERISKVLVQLESLNLHR